MSGPEIRWTQVELPMADLGPSSPLPAFESLQTVPDLAAEQNRGLDLDPAMMERIRYGRLRSPLPCALQNGYGLDLEPRTLPALQLSNGRLTATVLPQLGGRVWSLRDHFVDEDLIFENSQLAFANMALTDAWFAGGIEWNPGSTGHATTTARPLFAAEVETERGSLLRLWEWERTRDLVFQVDLFMPPDAPLMLASIRVRNPDPEPKPLYWWTNVAVAEHPGIRVIAPADRAWTTQGGGLPVDVSFPESSAGVEISYPLSMTAAVDYFFQLGTQRPWIAAAHADGSGLVHASTAALAGRKMFCWGSGNGGDHWQQRLVGSRARYLEVQGGLATTQLEHLVLEGGAEISWTEVFGTLEGDPHRLHGPWAAARSEVENRLKELVGSVGLTEWHAWWRTAAADLAPSAVLSTGSGAGRVELEVRGRTADALPGTPFELPDPPAGAAADSFDQLRRLVRGEPVDEELAAAQTLIPPVGPIWRPVLDRAAGGWWGELMIAVHAQESGDLIAALTGYRRSYGLRPTAWAARGSAILAALSGDAAGAVEHYETALALAPDCRPLLVEATGRLVELGRPQEALRLLDRAPETMEQGRLTLIRVRALMAAGLSDAAREIVDAGFEVPDLREGESLDAVWQQLHTGRPLPYRYDYRLHP